VASPYSPDTARAIAIGATAAGYVEYVSPASDDEAAAHNLQQMEQRLTAFALYQRDSLAALRRTLGLTPTTGVRVLCVGDSITDGAGSTDGTGYRTWLTDLLDQRRAAPTYSLQAYPGQTLRYVAPRAIAALPTARPDLVLVHLGTNCAMQNDLTDWQARYADLVDQTLASSPTVRVACARIQYSRNTTVAAREQQINGYIDAVVAARVAGGRVVTADMTGLQARWTEDGVHPMDAGYMHMAQQWAAAIGPWLPAT
jgi:lysophospholipase L1-like esterase